MRLSSLKLAGFKSFADSSTLQFKANRTAVVGPNGCGKSNVIDAIRWVMGESSARQLRGGSMQDVIFTGTAKRKPVGVASVELKFDNTYGKLGGAYNAYNELAVRRQVNRDGKSEYFLNGTRCRRRDITDIFLGTGLGPRSYAIIEQGMINRLVDAKPEEMRIFIEEAAGVSRYQARRRETLQHLEHTEQNLARLDDIAHELKSQLKSLKRQSEAAIHYKQLEQNIRTLKIEILSFQAEHASQLQQQYTVQMTALGEEFKLVRSQLHTIEHDLEASHALFQRLIQQSTPLQEQWQQAEKKLAEIKITLEQKQNALQQNSTALTALEQQRHQTKEQLQLNELQLENILTKLDEQSEQLQLLEQRTLAEETQNQQLLEQHKQAQQSFASLSQQVEKQQQLTNQMTMQLAQLNKNIERLELQKNTLSTQIEQIRGQVQPDELHVLEGQLQELAQAIPTYEQQLQYIEQQKQQHHAAQQELKEAVQHKRNQIHVLQAEQKNLTQLMVKESQSHSDEVALIKIFKLNAVAKPHAALIERLLTRWIDAHYLQQDMPFQQRVAKQLKITRPLKTQTQFGLTPLADWIDTPQLSIWHNIWLAEQIDHALAKQSELECGQSILTLDGYHVGQDWVVALEYDEQSQHSGLLAHSIRLEEIDQIVPVLEQEQSQLQQQYEQIEQQLKVLQHDFLEKQTLLKDCYKQQQSLEVSITKHQTSAQAFVLQQQQLQVQQQQLEEQLEDDAMQRDDLDIDLHALQIKLQSSFPDYQVKQQQLDTLTTQVEQQQKALLEQQQEREQLRRNIGQQQQQAELLNKDVSFLKNQYQQILAQIAQAQKFVDPVQLELPVLESAYQTQSETTEKLKKDWQGWQLELNQAQEKQKHLTEQRQHTQLKDDTLREQLEQQRLNWQAAKSDGTHYQEQLKELAAEALLGLNIDMAAHQRRLDQAQRQFEKLGAVNLAASDEYHEVSQRFEELSHQMQDLENTVTQLKDAMKSIDQETKKLFMLTFDRVNTELQELFPKVFSGGEASLSLEDDWQSGVKLMARPPGKRNSSLALLSGGEKALTALALVFAIFRLNPAPFCVLDEVDAPLDDANVQRFCNLVKELSEQVQFIYITHNKLAMTMATDLLGVTMPEPGTSKLVTVNLEEAKEYGLVTES